MPTRYLRNASFASASCSWQPLTSPITSASWARSSARVTISAFSCEISPSCASACATVAGVGWWCSVARVNLGAVGPFVAAVANLASNAACVSAISLAHGPARHGPTVRKSATALDAIRSAKVHGSHSSMPWKPHGESDSNSGRRSAASLRQRLFAQISRSVEGVLPARLSRRRSLRFDEPRFSTSGAPSRPPRKRPRLRQRLHARAQEDPEIAALAGVDRDVDARAETAHVGVGGEERAQHAPGGGRGDDGDHRWGR